MQSGGQAEPLKRQLPGQSLCSFMCMKLSIQQLPQPNTTAGGFLRGLPGTAANTRRAVHLLLLRGCAAAAAADDDDDAADAAAAHVDVHQARR